MGSHSGETMRVHVHTTFCFLCVLTFLFHQCSHCHGDSHHHNHGHPQGDHSHDAHEHAHEHAHNDLQISQDPYTDEGKKLGGGAGQVLAQEQHFYIQELFQRYGYRDQLDFRGFQSLLVSLGLGKVKVVGMEHDDLGHDHVTHLELLEVQEGLHSHLPTHRGPGHGHGHQHPRGRSHEHPHYPNTEPGPTHSTCHHLATGVSPTKDGGSLEVDHNHDYGLSLVKDDDHDHDHVHDHDHDHEPPSQPLHPEDHSNNTHHDHKHDIEHNHKPHTHHHPFQNSTENADRPLAHQGEPPSALAQTLEVQPMAEATGGAVDPVEKNSTIATSNSKRKKTRKPKGDKGVRNQGHEHHQEHGHGPASKAKRAVAPVSPTLQVPGLPGHPEGEAHSHEECLNLTQLFTYYGLSPDSRISPNQFTYLCPALLYQIDSRACIRHNDQVDVEQSALETATSAWVWMWGFVSITIISLLSLLGVILVPILNQGCFKFLLTFLVALAVGTLSGDALLHLLPHSQGEHDHSHGEYGNSSDTEEVDMLTAFDGVWKGLTALAGIYLLFIIEHCLGMFKHYKDAGGTFCRKKKKDEEAKIGRKLSDHKLNRRSDADWLHLKPLTEGLDSTTISCDNGHNDTQLSELQPLDTSNNKPQTTAETASDSLVKENGRRIKKIHGGHSHGGGHGHSHGGNCHSDQEMKDAGIASIAWMVIMGDGMHNFSDGLAIGAAFSANITGGISTSVAVFCHELPHELGDFAVLLKAGMSVKQAIVYNLLSALMAYVGMVIGTAVGQYTHNVTSWIFAVTAGMFLYVALVDMLPEMLHGDSEEHKRCQLGHFVLQNLGLLTGFSIMLLIAIFEDQIVFDFGF
ncbi:hypothetical protein DPEC_G00043230 [Dallia pectoralis]|uniref:Uncharacterized protein n=1 Tax=Dallia pectoralis TaxID=75939 RepID=A0ACC2H8Z9_DALPE|nr:hypothetical protein DPEC_G00043230 [Dallia pectoralis]